MGPADLSDVMQQLSPHAKAKRTIKPNLLAKIPYFTRIFPDKALWPLLVRISGDDGIAHFDQKTFAEGEKLISKGAYDQMIYWVLDGHADIVVIIKNQPKTIHVSRPVECIGAMGVLRGAVRIADVIAGKGGVDVIKLDWSITEKSLELAKDFYHLIALNLADELDQAYGMHLQLIANSMQILQKKTSRLIKKNHQLERLLREHGIQVDDSLQPDQTQALNLAISNIKESLFLLEMQAENRDKKRTGTAASE